jgi:hypothetical protein
MTDKSREVAEGWTGPGRRDGRIEPLPLQEDGLHSDRPGRGQYEWWYFDGHLESGHTIVVFFHASNANPGLEGKTGVEVVLLRPDGKRVQRFIPYDRLQFSAARDRPEVTIGSNTLRVEQGKGGLPVYTIHISEKDLGCDLTYTAEVNGWKPGSGLSRFGSMGSFGWVVPFARASVRGTVRDGEQTFPVSGIGYHDHNWLDFAFPRIIQYWMWGRIYSPSFTAAYAFIQCNARVNNHAVKVLMLAEGKKVILSSGEFDFTQEDFEYSPKAKHRFPRTVTLHAPGELRVTLTVQRVLEAQDMLEAFNPLLRFAARYLLGLRPGYFRLLSDFEMQVTRGEKTVTEKGTTLHEIVAFKPLG